jgi:hypothetical protein
MLKVGEFDTGSGMTRVQTQGARTQYTKHTQHTQNNYYFFSCVLTLFRLPDIDYSHNVFNPHSLPQHSVPN